MPSPKQYRFLEARPGSNYQQLWVKGRHMRAEVLYRCTVGPEPRTPQEVADDYELPLEAILEAVDYSVKNAALLTSEREREGNRAIVVPRDDVMVPDQQPFEA